MHLFSCLTGKLNKTTGKLYISPCALFLARLVLAPGCGARAAAWQRSKMAGCVLVGKPVVKQCILSVDSVWSGACGVGNRRHDNKYHYHHYHVYFIVTGVRLYGYGSSGGGGASDAGVAAYDAVHAAPPLVRTARENLAIKYYFVFSSRSFWLMLKKPARWLLVIIARPNN